LRARRWDISYQVMLILYNYFNLVYDLISFSYDLQDFAGDFFHLLLCHANFVC